MRAGSALIVLVLLVSGCGRSTPGSPAAAPGPDPSPAPGDDAGYRAPPRLTGAARAPGGAVLLSGSGLAGAAVRLASPAGAAEQTQVDASGDWTITVPAHAPAIYGLSQEADGRRDQAQGYLLVLPVGGVDAAELRSGAGARTLPPARLGKPQIDAVDLDGSGAAVVSGWATASQPVHVLVDGVSVDEGAANATGRFSLTLPKPLAPGPHAVEVTTPAGAAQVKLEAAAPAPFGGPLHVAPHGLVWRVDWLTPAGGVQTTFLFSPAGTGS